MAKKIECDLFETISICEVFQNYNKTVRTTLKCSEIYHFTHTCKINFKYLLKCLLVLQI